MTTLILDQLSRTYPAAVPVEALKGATLTIEQGDFLAIEGPSGAGKSTLLNILALLDTPTSGTYHIDCTDTATLNDAQSAQLRGSTFGFIFQSFHLLPRRSAVENVLLGMAYQGADPSIARQRAYDALAFVGLSQRADLPAQRLSGGERQRIAIARAICSSAPIIVADEPTGNLDSRSSQLIMDILAELNAQGTTVIIVTHDSAVAARAHRRIHVVDGIVTQSASDPASAIPSLPHKAQATQNTAENGQLAAAQTGLLPPIPAPAQSAPPVSRRRRRRLRRNRSDHPHSRLRPGMLWHDISQALTSDTARATRLIAVVVIAVTLFLTVLSLSYTAKYQVSEVFDAQRNRRVAIALTDPNDEGYIPNLVAHPDPDALKRVDSLAGVDEAMTISRHGDYATTTDPVLRTQDIPLFGITPATPLHDLLQLSEGSLPLQPGQVLIGQAAASIIGLGPLDASPTVWIVGKPYEIAGIITDAGIRSELLGAVVMSQEEASAVSPSSDNVLEIRTQPGAAGNVARSAALAWVPSRADDTLTDAPPDPTLMRDQLESNVRTALLTLTIVSALAGLAVLSNAMDNSVQTRTGELALRRAIGATRGHLRALIAGESALIGLVGGCLASVLSVLIVLAVTIVQQWRPVIDPLSFPLGIAAGVFTGLAAAVLASRKAGRIQPAQALRAIRQILLVGFHWLMAVWCWRDQVSSCQAMACPHWRRSRSACSWARWAAAWYKARIWVSVGMVAARTAGGWG